ncbi:MAG: class I SAM-dependent methyltransferase [Leptolyngbyaceae bacterium]|nr:class I SAM-dependent methyltransferase [Leptolyngbyaceae bacterium]
MQINNLEDVDKVRQQYEVFPYPHKPIDLHPRDADPNLNSFFIHSLVTPYYLRNQKVVSTEGKIILDAGCGSGYNALRLATANPGAQIVGIDLSPESVKLAEKRLQYHGVEDAEFHAMSIEDIPQLGLEFDYINCDEVLYLLPDPQVGLNTLMSVLKPDGILRSNLHSSFQRQVYYRAQELFRMMGLMDEAPGNEEVVVVQETMAALKDQVNLKANGWNAEFAKDTEANHALMNHLIQGDKGFTIPDLFAMLSEANAEFISMVNWRDWDLLGLFKDPDDLPTIWGFAIPNLSVEEQLRVFELMNPVHRLLDFWCGHPDVTQPFNPVVEWHIEDWTRATVSLNPLLQGQQIRNDLIDRIKSHRVFEFSRYMDMTTMTPISFESHYAAALLPLWDSPQPFSVLVKRYLQLHPIDPVTLEPTDQSVAVEQVRQLIQKLETFLYVMVERTE